MSMIGERIQKIIKDKGLTISSVARKLGEKRQRIQDVQSGKQRVPEDVMVKIVEIFNINAHWLLTGNGPIYLSIKNEGVASYGVAAVPVDLTKSWGKLSDEQKKEVVNRVEEMAELNKLKEFVTKFATQSETFLPSPAIL
ncbi:hypothetical protein PN36_20680 [Candidatus Thiomargarita nelsonii]|uniref:HTH cro/C1-type domain-containing protein n=1 Tax=Candidatus Thiomargarita nelsonii TaxID=1003181 RepID=A0A0A6P3M1_9GAMM|nr:hypothetical protein PN36_20680 [Candidatus Thiomargarita nelsonii]